MKSKSDPKNEDQVKSKSRLRENNEDNLEAVVLALFIRTFVVQAFKIPSGSMMNTLLVGDHILVNKFIYGVKLPFWRTTLMPSSNPNRGFQFGQIVRSPLSIASTIRMFGQLTARCTLADHSTGPA